MGIVKKQVYKNTIVSYAGMAIAYINTVLLFPFFTNSTQYGFYNLIISVSVLYSLVASMGVPGILLRYFPFYRTEDRKHNGFLHWTALIALFGFIVVSALYIILKPVILSAYTHTSPLFVHYYYYLIPMSFFIIAFNYLEMTGRIVYLTIYSNFLQTILLRLLTTVFLIMIAFKWIDFNDFVFLYIGSNGLISLLLLISIVATGKFSYRLNDYRFKTIEKRAMINFGLFTVVSSAIYVLLQKVDTLMLSSMAGDAIQGAYSWYFNIAIVISVPAQALNRTTYTIVADAWKTKDMGSIAAVYSKTSIIQMIIGSLLFIGIIINRQNLYAIAHNKEFTDPKYFSLFVVIGFGFLVDITGGLNAYIITASHKYRLFTILIIAAIIFCIALNYLLIPIYQGLGSAIAYLFTITGLNFATWFYIKYRFKMQPFTVKHIWVILISAVSFLIGYYFWRMPNVFADIVVRSTITTAVYGLLTYYFNISKDVNDKVDSYLNKVVKLIK
jgi:O-antigen/teichoic acid export membrane protein